jgi:hypothetical protein
VKTQNDSVRGKTVSAPLACLTHPAGTANVIGTSCRGGISHPYRGGTRQQTCEPHKNAPLTPRGEPITPLPAAGSRVPGLIRAWPRRWAYAFHRQGFFRHRLLFISVSVFAKYLLHLVADQFEPAIPFRVSLDNFPFWLFLPYQICVSHCGNRLAEMLIRFSPRIRSLSV